MDADHFDTLTRHLVTPSRRHLLSVLASAVSGSALAATSDDNTAAKGTRRQHKHRQDRHRAADERVDAEKRKKKKKKKGTTAPDPGTASPPPPVSPPCPGGQTLCGGACVDLMTDSANCGRCGRRCQLNGICANGTCRCEQALSCPTDATCCPQRFCYCAVAPHYWINAGTCEGSDMPGPIGSCPPNTTPCTGPQCRACCPANAPCDPSTGTCLCDPAAGTCRQFAQCPPEADYCTNRTPTCGNGGFCLRPFDGGPTRCGVHNASTDGSMCNCTSHQECEARLNRPGAFCAKVSGSNCSCPIPGQAGGTTFCVSPR